MSDTAHVIDIGLCGIRFHPQPVPVPVPVVCVTLVSEVSRSPLGPRSDSCDVRFLCLRGSRGTHLQISQSRVCVQTLQAGVRFEPVLSVSYCARSHARRHEHASRGMPKLRLSLTAQVQARRSERRP
jgi:hypothetical protein